MFLFIYVVFIYKLHKYKKVDFKKLDKTFSAVAACFARFFLRLVWAPDLIKVDVLYIFKYIYFIYFL